MKYPISDPSAYLHDGKFHDGDPTQGIPSSVAKASQMNVVYDELINLIKGGNQTPSETSFNQVKSAVDWLIAQGIATRAPQDHGHTWSQISGTPATYPPSAHDHAYVASAGNANTVGGYSAAQLWRTDQQARNFSGNGYVSMPNGLIIQWGYAGSDSAYGTGERTNYVTFPIRFPNAVLGIVQSMLPIDLGFNYNASIGYRTASAIGFYCVLRRYTSNGSWNKYFVAIGY